MKFKRFNKMGQGRRVLYAGDGDSDRAAAYLLCVLCDAGYQIDYLPSSKKMEFLPSPYPDLMILSDYPRAQVPDFVLAQITLAVEGGMHLLVVGGWESLRGKTGEYYLSPLDRILPVVITDEDDRVNTWQGVVVQPAGPAGPFDSLDWSRPPVVAGYNRLNLVDGAETLVVGRPLAISAGLEFTLGPPVPLACSRRAERGRSTVLAFDLAPHWVAGMVDWGVPRHELGLPDGSGVLVEVGELYRKFVHTFLDLC